MGDLACMDVAADLVSWPPKSVIYATDFSPSAERAGQYAQLLARQLGAGLVVAHAFTVPHFAVDTEIESGQSGKAAERKALEGALAAAARRVGGAGGRVSSVLVEGDPVNRIPELARENAPSIIVLGTRGRGRLGRGMIGSAADGILRLTDGPSLIVGPLAPEVAEGGTSIRSVLFATDLSPAAARCAAYAVGIAEGFGADLEALHVVRPQEMNDPKRLSAIRKEFHAALEGAIPRYAEGLFEPKESIEEGSAHMRILEHLRESRADLLVLAVRKSAHVWLRERVSAAFHIVANATCPVMTITG